MAETFTGQFIEEEARREIERVAARGSLSNFAQYVQTDYINARHAQVLCSYLDRWAFGDIDRLMIFMPPRHGKSQHVSRLSPAYILGRDPNAEIIACSYGASLASDMNTDVQRIIQSDRYAELFPGTKLGGKRVVTLESQPKLNSQTFELVNAGGTYVCAGVNGPIGGKGFTYGFIDDVIKNRIEADSPRYRDNNEDWYDSTFWQRRNTDRAKICLTVTRWHEDDLPGRLLKRMKEGGERWVVLKLPRICIDPTAEGEFRQAGEVLWPERLSLEDAKTGESNNPYEFSAVQQQEPTHRSGNAIKKEWYVQVDVFNSEDVTGLFFGIDEGFSSQSASDYSWGSLKAALRPGNGLGVNGEDLIELTLWQHFGRWDNPDRDREYVQQGLKIKRMIDAKTFPNLKQWHITPEAGVGPGHAIVKDFLNALLRAGLPASTKSTNGINKVVRANGYIAAVQAKKVGLYRGTQLRDFGFSNGTDIWINSFLNAAGLLRFDNDAQGNPRFVGGKDDMIDAEVISHEGCTTKTTPFIISM